MRYLTFHIRTRIRFSRYGGMHHDPAIWSGLAQLFDGLAAAGCTALRSITLELADLVSDGELKLGLDGLRGIERSLAVLQQLSELRITVDPTYPPLTFAHRAVFQDAMKVFYNRKILIF